MPDDAKRRSTTTPCSEPPGETTRTVASLWTACCSRATSTRKPLACSERTNLSASASSSTPTTTSTSRVVRGSARALTARPPTRAQLRFVAASSPAMRRRAASSEFTLDAATVQAALLHLRLPRRVAAGATARCALLSLRRCRWGALDVASGALSLRRVEPGRAPTAGVGRPSWGWRPRIDSSAGRLGQPSWPCGCRVAIFTLCQLRGPESPKAQTARTPTCRSCWSSRSRSSGSDVRTTAGEPSPTAAAATSASIPSSVLAR